MNSRYLGRILLLVASVAAIYLTWMTTQGTEVPGCGKESSCDTILSSRWSHVAGIPVGALGSVIYTLLLLISFRRPSKRILLTICISTILLSAIWFSLVQAFIIHSFCLWCCSIHATAAIGAILIWWSFRPKKKRSSLAPSPEDGLARAGTFLLAGTLVASMAFWQWKSAEQEKIKEVNLPQDSISTDSHKLYLYGHKVVVDQDRLPSIGNSSEAPIAVLVSDFTCPYCLAVHSKLKTLEKKYPGILRTIILPGFHDNDARKIHQLMLVLWRANPELYEQITQGLIDGNLPQEPTAINHLIKNNHPGDFSLDIQTYGRWAAEMLGAGKDLMLLNGNTLGSSNLPQLMIGKTIITGNPTLATLREKAEASGIVKQTKEPWTPNNIKLNSGWEKPLTQGFKYEFEILDLGRPQRGKEFIAEFKFVNTGTDPVTINRVDASCGCANTEFTNNTIQPGEGGSYKVIIDSRSIQGPFKNTVTVSHSRSKKPHKVRLIADVWSPMAAYPNGFDFGIVIRGKKSTPITSKLVALEGKPVKISSVNCDNPAFIASIKPLGGGRQYELTVTPIALLDPQTARKQHGTVNIAIDNPRHPTFRLPINATFVEPVETSPKKLLVTLENHHTEQLIVVTCHDKKKSDFTINKVSIITGTESQELKTIQTKKRNVTQLKFKISAPQRESLYKKNDSETNKPQLLIETNYPGYLRLKIPIELPSTKTSE